MLLTRASNGKLGEPAPDEETVQLSLRAAARSPDHGLMRPWRVQIVRGRARERLGQVMREALLQTKPDATSQELDKQGTNPLRAPLLFVISARLRENPKVPDIEQVLSAGAVAHNILLTLHARGFAGMWRTGPMAYHPSVKQALGLEPRDAIVGFVYAGTPQKSPAAIERPGPEVFAEEWTGEERGTEGRASAT